MYVTKPEADIMIQTRKWRQADAGISCRKILTLAVVQTGVWQTFVHVCSHIQHIHPYKRNENETNWKKRVFEFQNNKMW